MPLLSLAAKSTVFLGATSLIMQVVPIGADGGILVQASRLTLDGALVIAVAVLWKKLSEKDSKYEARIEQKDKAVMDALVSTTAALTATSDASKELRRSIENLGATHCPYGAGRGIEAPRNRRET